MKTCTKCRETKENSLFYSQKSSKDGLRSWCKSCMNNNNGEWRKNNQEISSEISRRYYSKNKEKVSLSHKAWREQNPEKKRLANKNWKSKNIDYVKEYNKERYETKKKHILDVLKEWISKNRKKRRLYEKNRSAQKKNGQGKITLEQWEDIKNKYGNRCLKCGKNTEVLTIDHVIPLSAGGANVIENIQPLCRSCNSSKGKNIIDYRRNLT